MSDETPKDLDPRFNPFLPCGGDSYIIPKAEVQEAAAEIAGKQLLSKMLDGAAGYKAEYGEAAVPSIGGRELVISYTEAAGELEVLIDGKSLNVIDGSEAQAILAANTALQRAIVKEEDRKKYLTTDNPLVKL